MKLILFLLGTFIVSIQSSDDTCWNNPYRQYYEPQSSAPNLQQSCSNNDFCCSGQSQYGSCCCAPKLFAGLNWGICCKIDFGGYDAIYSCPVGTSCCNMGSDVICGAYDCCSAGETCHTANFPGQYCSARCCPAGSAPCPGYHDFVVDCCSDLSQCVNGKCMTCANNTCSGHGTCHNGVCTCDSKWAGMDCSIPNACASTPCYNDGTCYQGQCSCDSGWTGPDCSTPTTPCSGITCLNSGSCLNGHCVCPQGYLGPTCATPCSNCDVARASTDSATTTVDNSNPNPKFHFRPLVPFTTQVAVLAALALFGGPSAIPAGAIFLALANGGGLVTSQLSFFFNSLSPSSNKRSDVGVDIQASITLLGNASLNFSVVVGDQVQFAVLTAFFSLNNSIYSGPLDFNISASVVPLIPSATASTTASAHTTSAATTSSKSTAAAATGATISTTSADSATTAAGSQQGESSPRLSPRAKLLVVLIVCLMYL